MHLSFRQLSTFREVMRSGSMSQAARAVGRTQPAVSTMIQTLEDQLGFQLFTRQQSKLIPTPEAHFFLEECEEILTRVERAERTLERIGRLQSGKLQVACHPAASSIFLPQIMTKFLQDRSDFQVSLIMRSSDMIEDLIASQQYDVGFSETPQQRASIHQIDYDLECLCVLRSDDPLAKLDHITPHDLEGRPMAVLFDQHRTAVQTESAFRTVGCTFNKRIELRTFLPGLQFVAAGQCTMVCDMVTAYSYMLQSPHQDNLTFRRFIPKISNSVSILTPGYTTQSQAAKLFISQLQQAVSDMMETMSDIVSR
jgi:DNA-binding transcriptional LysR family regulator